MPRSPAHIAAAPDMLTPPALGANDAGWMTAAKGSRSWLDSLPVAAALLARKDGALAIRQANEAFYKQHNSSPDAIFPIQAELRAALLRFACQTGAGYREEVWQSSVIAQRPCKVTLAPIDASNQDFLLTLSAPPRRNEISAFAGLDPLTGLFDRSGFEQAITKTTPTASADSDKDHFGFLVVDLSRFSRVNESLGSAAGDELLVAVAGRLRARLRADELLARIGGNEFAVFARFAGNENPFEAIASRLTEALKEPCNIADLDIQMDCASGAAWSQSKGASLTEILRQAQVATRKSKVTKRFEYFQPETGRAARERLSLETELRRAIDRNDLHLNFQPLVDLKTGAINGFEALARWTHDELGEIGPARFIPVAEESGQIVPLGRWVMEQAANTLCEWDKAAGERLPLHIAVNLSATQMQHDDVGKLADRVLQRTGVGGERLTLELTESALVSDPTGAKRTLDLLKANNICLAMDDFGTGYSNLAYLQQLPIDMLKIDRSFVTGLQATGDKAAIVKAILSLAQSLGLGTTAEGIEDEALLGLLKNLGCSVGQGYFFAKPLAADDAFRFISSHRGLEHSGQ